MSPAPRLAANRSLERNLYTHPNGGFRWRNPRTGKCHYFGKVSRDEANAAARTLNAKFGAQPSIVDRVLGHAATSVRALVTLHREEVLAKARLAIPTRKNREYRLAKIAKDLGDYDAGDISTAELAVYMRGLASDSMRQAYRATLVDLFRTAVEEGYRPDNPANALRQVVAERKRSRLELDGLKAIYRASPRWLRLALRLGLTSCLRRDDLASLQFSQYEGGVLRVRPKKNRRSAGDQGACAATEGTNEMPGSRRVPVRGAQAAGANTGQGATGGLPATLHGGPTEGALEGVCGCARSVGLLRWREQPADLSRSPLARKSPAGGCRSSQGACASVPRASDSRHDGALPCGP